MRRVRSTAGRHCIDVDSVHFRVPGTRHLEYLCAYCTAARHGGKGPVAYIALALWGNLCLSLGGRLPSCLGDSSWTGPVRY